MSNITETPKIQLIVEVEVAKVVLPESQLSIALEVLKQEAVVTTIVEQGLPGPSKYKNFDAIISQLVGFDPTVDQLFADEFPGVVITRYVTGKVRFSLPGGQLFAKAACSAVSPAGVGNFARYNISRQVDGTVMLEQYNSSNEFFDGFTGLRVQIQQYPN
jgi:hypothetical protein